MAFHRFRIFKRRRQRFRENSQSRAAPKAFTQVKLLNNSTGVTPGSSCSENFTHVASSGRNQRITFNATENAFQLFTTGKKAKILIFVGVLLTFRIVKLEKFAETAHKAF